jgi:hypothetical protein
LCFSYEKAILQEGTRKRPGKSSAALFVERHWELVVALIGRSLHFARYARFGRDDEGEKGEGRMENGEKPFSVFTVARCVWEGMEYFAYICGK